ncbi:hypothetical protein MTBPR1_130018 [Candidatus Terasakiella magnetica]|uniref:Uncharacterized protein n=1 Tax=Candidatus Terasakiella magnetica TaxID=1867952 RepID=A0A1C3RF15_9PROT|nr:hypothetical protein [Candidatus Terasakiella magnetica]SCA55822.1 hypothetical protein MTBPR1_130018 [Candidatus Terasakiella magnetica]
MSLDELIKEYPFLEDMVQAIDDPFTLVLVFGSTIVLAMLVLLRVTFLSMGKADQKRRDTL